MAIHSRAGTLAPRSAPTASPGRPSAFITTTVQDPSAGFHTTFWGPGPVAEAAQKVCTPGVAAGLPPSTNPTLSVQKSEMTVWLTPAR